MLVAPYTFRRESGSAIYLQARKCFMMNVTPSFLIEHLKIEILKIEAKMKGRVKVILTPLGNKIKFRLVARVYCTQLDNELPNSRTYQKEDLRWLSIFGSKLEIKKFLKRNKRITKILSLDDLGYDPCDQLALRA